MPGLSGLGYFSLGKRESPCVSSAYFFLRRKEKEGSFFLLFAEQDMHEATGNMSHTQKSTSRDSQEKAGQRDSGHGPCSIPVLWYHPVFHATHDPVVIVRRDGRILDANDQFGSFSECRENDATCIHDFLNSDGQSLWERSTRCLLEDKLPVASLETQFFTRTGKKRNVEISISTQEGNPEVFLAVIRDNTPMKEKESILRIQYEELQKIFDTVPHILLVIDGTKKVRRFNRTGSTALGLRNPDSINNRLGEILSCIHRREAVRGCGFGRSCRNCILHQSMVKCIKLGESAHFDEVTVVRDRGDRKLYCYEVHVSPLDYKGKRWGLLSFDDITEKREAKLKTFQLHNNISKMNLELKKTLEDLATSQARLMDAQKLEQIGLLASGLAHNLKTPLSGIKGYAQLLQMDHPEFHEIDTILHEVSAMEAIINNLMSKNRREHEMCEEPIQLNELIGFELDLLKANLFFKHNVTTEVTLDPQLPPIQGVYHHFSQIVCNIIQNALDAMYESKEKTLSIRTRYDDHHVYLDISDTGCGIPEKIREKVFQVFFTTKPSPMNRKQDEPVGTGLGLSSVNYYIMQYGGKIDVQSEEGKGTTVSIMFPLDHGNQTEQRKILVVDDSEEVLNTMVKICQELGYEVFGTQDGENALKLYRKVQPHLVISDLVMPGLSGSELISKIREYYPEQKVLYITGYLGDPHFQEWIDKEKNSPERCAVMQKPFRVNVLRNVLIRFMGDS